MTKFKKYLAAGVFASVAAFATQAHALVFSPYDTVAVGNNENISFVTPGYIASYWITDGDPVLFPNSSPAQTESDSESVTGLSLTGASNTECTGSSREGLGGSDGTNKKCIGNVFTVKVNDVGYAIFVYASALNLLDFDIEVVPLPRGSQGKLSHMDVYNSAPSPVPVPGAALLLGSGLLGLGALKRRNRKA